MATKKKGTRYIFDSGYMGRSDEGILAACLGAVTYLTDNIGIDDRTAHEAISHELGHAIADDGNGRLVLKTDIADPEASITPVYIPTGRRSEEQIRRIIEAAGQKLSQGDAGLLNSHQERK